MLKRIPFRRFLPDLLALLLLATLPLLVFWQVWAPNPADRVIFGGDILMGAYPTRVFVHRLFDAGMVPLWNPYQLGGMPLLGDVQVAPYYLPNLLLDWLYRGQELSYLAFELLVVAHYALGGLFLYAYLRGLGVIPTAALIGSIAFQFNGFFVGHRGHYSMLAVTVWLPAVLWTLDRSWHTPRPAAMIAWSVAAGLALSQMVMAGHPQLTLYCALAIAAYAAYRWADAWKHPASKWERLRVPATFALAGLLALGIAAVTLLPVAELLGRSRRGDLSYTFTAQHSLMPRNLLSLLMPEFLNWSGTEYRIYAGILTLALVAVAWAVPEHARPERRFFTVTIAVALIIALGGFTALHGLLYRFVPGLGSVRVSARAFYIANLALAVLAAFGAEHLLRGCTIIEQQRLRRLVHGAMIMLTGALLVGIGAYALLVGNYRPVGEEFYFAENLFNRDPSSDTYTLLTQTVNAYGVFLVLLTTAIVLLWTYAFGRLSRPGLALAMILLIVLDMATFTPYHDTIRADPDTARFTVRQYATTMLTEDWQIIDQDVLIERLAALPDALRVDNAAEVLPDNYSQIYRIAFATGYNVLDLQERFTLLSQWPYLSDAARRDLLNTGYVLTAPETTDPPEEGARLIVENSQGRLWERAVQPAYTHFSTSLRPASTLITLNGLLNLPGDSLNTRPTLSADEGNLHTTLAELWPEAVDPALYMIGTSGVQSPVALSVLAGGPIRYSAVIVDGVTVTPKQRGIVIAMIDPQNGTVLKAGGFDTYQSAAEADRLVSMIEAAPNGTIVALATYDEGLAKIGPAAQAAIGGLGGQINLANQVGAAYALIGVKGAPAGSALEALDRVPVMLDLGPGAMPAGPAQVRSHMLSYTAERISLSVENDVRGLLTISESTYPGWEAYVDGMATPILRANGLLRAIILPPALAGHPHEVTFVYRPLSARLGGAVSLLSLALAAAISLSCAVALVPPLTWPRRRRTVLSLPPAR